MSASKSEDLNSELKETFLVLFFPKLGFQNDTEEKKHLHSLFVHVHNSSLEGTFCP